ncbi:MAG: transglycosylase SLT domain-containing protein [Xanthobacteraceae bacterium]
MKAWQLSGFAGALGTMTLAAIGQHATIRPRIAGPNAIVEAAFAAVPADATPSAIKGDFSRALQAAGRVVLTDYVAPNTTIMVESNPVPPAPPVATAAPELSTRPARFIIDTEFRAAAPNGVASTVTTGSLAPSGMVLAYAAPDDGLPHIKPVSVQPASLQPQPSPVPGPAAPAARHESFLKYYPFSEVPPQRKPAEIVMDELKGVPLGTPIEEIKRAAEAFGLDFNFMKAVAKIESDFNPRDRTGSYIGLFQLSKAEFRHYGAGGDITNPRDNAIAAAAKFINEAAQFEMATNKAPTNSDLYLIHQQGWAGAAEHVSHPDRIAWKSMCATDEGIAKGERWCKRAIWWNTLPAIKREWKSVDRLTSAAFVAMWRDRINSLYARYADAGAANAPQ